MPVPVLSRLQLQQGYRQMMLLRQQRLLWLSNGMGVTGRTGGSAAGRFVVGGALPVQEIPSFLLAQAG
ncbi:hypothetical protein MJ588_00290 [Klebsiella pneumoniae]|nr:hypothetical protein MJ588_00290 [Klebsiella pneumoniae]